MKKLIIAAAAMAVSTGALAGPSWTYVDLGLVFNNYSPDADEDSVGYALRGSFGFADLWHVQAAVASTELNGGKSKGGADITLYDIRGGIHPAVTDNVDFVLDIGYEGGEAKTNDGSEKLKPSRYDVRTGVRADVGKLELRSFISIGQTDFDSKTCGPTADKSCKGRDIRYSVGGQYNFSDAWSLGADYIVNAGDTDVGAQGATNVYVRWSF